MALSRGKKDNYPPHVKHSFIDLTASADEMTNDLKHVQAEYVFFAAYLQKDSEQENWDVNGELDPSVPTCTGRSSRSRLG